MSSNCSIQQTVIGSNNIFSATGDVYVIQNPLPPAEAKTRRELGILLKKVKTFWIEGVLEKSLHNTILIELGKESHSESIDHPWENILELPDQASRVLPHETKITDIYEQSNRALLILGEPGSGKTITMLELARELILQAENDNEFTQPVPVVFNLSSWAAQSWSLMEWMISELTLKYKVPKNVGQVCLEENRILPLLDGLDEVKKESRTPCVEAINTFAGEFGLSGLVVCCRLADYAQLSLKLKLNAAIYIQPLSAQQIDEYLGKVGELENLRLSVSHDKSLQELAQSPLMLSIMSLIYRSESASELMDSTILELPQQREHLFNAYITKMLTRKGTRKKTYTDGQTISWLSWLAKQMQNHKEPMFLIEQLQASWLPIHNQGRYQYGPLWVIIVTLGITISWWNIERGFMPGLSDWVISDWLAYVLGAIIFGWFIWLLVWYGNIKSVETLKLSKQTIIESLRGGAAIGVAFAFVVVIWGFFNELTGMFDWIHLLMTAWPFSTLSSSASDSVTIILFLLYLYFLIRILERLANITGWKNTGRIAAMLFLLSILWRYLMIPNFVTNVWNALILGLTTGINLLLAAIGLALSYGLISGLTYTQVEDKAKPNQGIRQSIWNALLVGPIGVLTGASIGMVFWLSSIFGTVDWAQQKIYDSVSFVIWGGALGGLIGTLRYGGAAAVKHYSLRLLLSIGVPHLPLRLASFLDYSAEYIFLRKVGGGYIFIHRLLMEHFAGMEEKSSLG